MSNPTPNPETKESRQILELAGQKRPSLIREYYDYMRRNKKWWLVPIIVSLLLLAGLIILSASSVAPIIYTLF